MSRPGSLHAEWTKLRTLPSTWWLLTATVVLTAAVGTVAVSSSATRPDDPVRVSLTGVQLSQSLCLVLGALSMGAEYGTGTIRTTLTAMPGRWRVLLSKALALSALTAAAGSLAVLSTLALAHLTLPLPTNGTTLRAATGSIVILVLVTLLGLSLATLLRDTAGAITLGLGILYVIPILSHLVNSPTWQHRLQRWTPMPAALSIQATKNLEGLAIAPWPGLGVLTAYAMAFLAVAGAALRTRDA
ncbi:MULTISPECIES: ABC transporter permease [unclassified Streptomyces]|uniref:ABC transporter permease n=1 Tax=unclassified Streptomyces TaxID=2593676 RepID=UPI00332D65D0